MQYAGAGRPLIIATKNNIEKIKCASYGISGNVSENIEFALNEFDVAEGDQIYLYSDGIVDQFGGPRNKKFMTKRLLQLLSSNSALPMNEQKEIIDHINLYPEKIKWMIRNELSQPVLKNGYILV